MIQPTRVRVLNNCPVRGSARFVLYWMQQAQRATSNHALEYATARANAIGLPLVVCFGLMDGFPEANVRHYAFMLQGLADLADILRARGVQFVLRHGDPPAVALELSSAAATVVCDRGYLRIQKRWRDRLADEADCDVVEVESDVVVPADVASDKQEFSARTLRPKIHRRLSEYLLPVSEEPISRPSISLKVPPGRHADLDPKDVAGNLSKLKLDRSVPISEKFIGGSTQARKMLLAFLETKLASYADGRREPAGNGTSFLSGYLHFGQISALEIALAVRAMTFPPVDRDAFLEELIVRRELAVNYVHHCPSYDRYDGLPAWALKTLNEHSKDERPVLYERAQLEAAETADEYWNAAQREMVTTGYMHNSMRMYWGKKILEWTADPESAYQTTLYLNNRYFICGRDVNSFANVSWIFGLHDRPWGPVRPIFGLVRYMNAAGLKRKFDMGAYLTRYSRE